MTFRERRDRVLPSASDVLLTTYTMCFCICTFKKSYMPAHMLQRLQGENISLAAALFGFKLVISQARRAD